MSDQSACIAEILSSPCVVISQPMYFPWPGMLEQIKLCDIFVYYDDVQFSRGSFSNRVQVKTSSGMRWLTVPLHNLHLGQLIREVEINNKKDWRRSHRDLLKQAYANCPHKIEMLKLVDDVFANQYKLLSELSKATTMILIDYFNLCSNRTFMSSSSLPVQGSSSQRVIDLCLHLNAKTYLTGHGAKNYLMHEQFEDFGIDVKYINYGLHLYPQSYGAFTPYVSSLDLVAHCGREGIRYISGKHLSWKQFISIN